MFQPQGKLGDDGLVTDAEKPQFNTKSFSDCPQSGKYAGNMKANLLAGSTVTVTGTPALSVGRRFLAGAQGLEAIEKVVNEVTRENGWDRPGRRNRRDGGLL